MAKSFLGFAVFVSILANLIALKKAFGFYKTYRVDYKPLLETPSDFRELIHSQKEAMLGDLSRSRLERHIEIIEKTLQKHPKWVDGLWILACETFQLGSSYTKEEEQPFGREILLKGQKATEACLSLDPENPICKFFLASAMAKIGTIDGVLASISAAERVKDLWQDVTKSPYNIQFTPAISMQGAVRYALGIFYRLVPDYVALEWMYGVKGDLEKSVSFHQKSLAIDDPRLPCSNLMLGAALLCLSETQMDDGMEEQGEKTRADGLSYLEIAQKSEGSFSVNSAMCKKDALMLMQRPQDACSYSMAGQQEESPSLD